MAVYGGPDIVTDGLEVGLDMSSKKSFISGGTTINSLVSNDIFTIYNNPEIILDKNLVNLNFSNTSEYANIETTPLNLQVDPNFTVMGVFKRNGTVNGNACWGIGGDSTSQGFNSFVHSSGGNDRYSFDLWGRTTVYVTGQIYPLDEWVVVHWIKSSGDLTTNNIIFFINNIKYETSDLAYARNNPTTPNINNNGVVLGRAGNTTDNYYAKIGIGCIYFYNRTLSDYEALQNYRVLQSRFN